MRVLEKVSSRRKATSIASDVVTQLRRENFEAAKDLLTFSREESFSHVESVQCNLPKGNQFKKSYSGFLLILSLEYRVNLVLLPT